LIEIREKEKQSKSRQKVKSVAIGTKKDIQGRSLRAELLQALHCGDGHEGRVFLTGASAMATIMSEDDI
jgi:hypothetical protein